MITLEPTEEQLEQLNELEELMTKAKPKTQRTFERKKPWLLPNEPRQVTMVWQEVRIIVDFYR